MSDTMDAPPREESRMLSRRDVIKVAGVTLRRE
jgi:hypothetical protein